MSEINKATSSKTPKTIVGFFKHFDEIISYILDETTGLYKPNLVSIAIILKDINEMYKIKYFLLLDGYNINEINSAANFEIKNNAINLGLLPYLKDSSFDYLFIIDLANDDGSDKSTKQNKNNYYLSSESYLQFALMANKHLYLLSSGNPAKYLSEIANEDNIEKIGNPEDPASMCPNFEIFPYK